jgi:hypothetical protein
MRLLSFLFRNRNESQASEQTEMLQSSLPPQADFVQSLADYLSCRSAVLEMDHHRDCKGTVYLRMSSFVQYAKYTFHGYLVRPFDDSIRLRLVGRSRVLYYAL